MSSMTRPTQRASTRLVTGYPGQRKASLDACLQNIPAGASLTVILEGAPADGSQEIPQEIIGMPDISTHILAPGCMCCIGSLALRVTLARVLRLEQPRHLILGLVDALHRESLVKMLLAHPYDAWIELIDPAQEAESGGLETC